MVESQVADAAFRSLDHWSNVKDNAFHLRMAPQDLADDESVTAGNVHERVDSAEVVRVQHGGH